MIIRIYQSQDRTWKRWGIVGIHRDTQWVRSRRAAIRDGLGFLGGPGIPHTIKVTQPKEPITIEVSTP